MNIQERFQEGWVYSENFRFYKYYRVIKINIVDKIRVSEPKFSNEEIGDMF